MYRFPSFLLGAAMLGIGCADSPTRSPQPSFEITSTGRAYFEVSGFATTGDGTIIYDGAVCDSSTVVSENHSFYGPGMVPEVVHVDKHHFYRLGMECRRRGGVIDVVGLLDGQYQVYASQVPINGTDRAQIDNFPGGENVTLAATADAGCGFMEWRRNDPFYGSIVSTQPSISIEPEEGVTYVGVVMCPPPAPPPAPPPPPPDPCIICPGDDA